MSGPSAKHVTGHLEEKSATETRTEPKLATSETDLAELLKGTEKPGFARGKFGRLMAYPLFVIGMIGTLISISEWYSSWQYGQPAEYAGGRVLGMIIIVGAGVRALARRSHRSLLDWFLAGILLLVCAGGVYGLVAILMAPNFYMNAFFYVYLATLLLVVGPSFVVMVRLLRQPYYIRGEDGERPRLA